MEQISFADKACDKQIGRISVDFLRRCDLTDAAFVHNSDAIRHREGFFLIVGNVDHGLAHFVVQRFNLVAEMMPQFLVERPKRLVKEEDWRIENQCTAMATLCCCPPDIC